MQHLLILRQSWLNYCSAGLLIIADRLKGLRMSQVHGRRHSQDVRCRAACPWANADRLARETAMNSTTMGFSSHDLSDPHCHIHFVHIRSLHMAVRAVRGRVHLSFCGTARDVHKDEVARLSKTAQESRSEKKKIGAIRIQLTSGSLPAGLPRKFGDICDTMTHDKTAFSSGCLSRAAPKLCNNPAV